MGDGWHNANRAVLSPDSQPQSLPFSRLERQDANGGGVDVVVVVACYSFSACMMRMWLPHPQDRRERERAKNSITPRQR